MQTNQIFSASTWLRAAMFLAAIPFITAGSATAKVTFTDSAIVIPAGSNKSITTTYDNILQHPALQFGSGQRVIGFEVSFQPKGKNYYGPYKATGNKLTRRQLELIKQFRDEQVPVTKLFIESIMVRDGSSAKAISGSAVITLQPH